MNYANKSIAGIAVVLTAAVSACLAKTVEATGSDCQNGQATACAKLVKIATSAKKTTDRLAAIPFISNGSVLSAIAGDAAQTAEVRQAAVARLWENVSRSDSMKEYANFLDAHPSEHQADVKALADKWLRSRVAAAERYGRRVKHFPVPATNVGTTWEIKGGEINFGHVFLYSDPTEKLAVGVRQSLFGPLEEYLYARGKGIGVSGDLVYCFGF
jgi:hypothetical protein